MPTTKLIGILLLGQLKFLVILTLDHIIRIDAAYFKNWLRERGIRQEKPEKIALSLCYASRQGTKSICSNVISKQAIARSKNCNGDQRWPVQ